MAASVLDVSASTAEQPPNTAIGTNGIRMSGNRIRRSAAGSAPGLGAYFTKHPIAHTAGIIQQFRKDVFTTRTHLGRLQ